MLALGHVRQRRPDVGVTAAYVELNDHGSSLATLSRAELEAVPAGLGLISLAKRT